MCYLISLTINHHNRIHGSDKSKRPGTGTLLITTKCVICGKEFERPFNLNQTTCSKECRSERKRIDGHKSWKVREINLRKEYPIIDDICGWCGKDIKRIQYPTDSKYKLYCI